MLFSNFTERARIAISDAHDTACELGHRYIGSEHIVSGLIKEGSGVAAKLLEKYIGLDAVLDIWEADAEITFKSYPMSA